MVFCPALWLLLGRGFFFFKIYLFIFWLHRVLVAAHRIFHCGMRASLQLWHAGFLSLVVACRLQGMWALQLWCAALECMSSVVCSTWALVEARKFSSCGTQAQLPQGMWDLTSLTRDRTRIPCIARQILYHWTTREVPRERIYLSTHSDMLQVGDPNEILILIIILFICSLQFLLFLFIFKSVFMCLFYFLFILLF